jgi:hypothetical protein
MEECFSNSSLQGQEWWDEDEDDEEEEEEQEQPLYLLTCWLHPVHPIPVFS